MPTMNISLTDHLKQVVEKRIADGRYSSASEYMRELIRADEMRARLAEMPSIIDPDDYPYLSDQERDKEEDKLEALLLEGMKGESTPMTKQDWADIRAEGIATLEARSKERNGKC